MRFDEFHETLAGGGRTWAVGGKLKVRVEKVDFDRRQIDFVPVAERAVKEGRPSRGRKTARREQPRQAKGEQGKRRKRR